MESPQPIEPIRKASDALLRDKLIDLIESSATQTPCGHFADLILNLVREHQSEQRQKYPEMLATVLRETANPEQIEHDLLMSALAGLTLGRASDERSLFVSELNKRLRAREKEGSGV